MPRADQKTTARLRFATASGVAANLECVTDKATRLCQNSTQSLMIGPPPRLRLGLRPLTDAKRNGRDPDREGGGFVLTQTPQSLTALRIGSAAKTTTGKSLYKRAS